MIPNVVDLLGAPRTNDSKVTSKTAHKAAAKAKRLRGGPQSEAQAKKSKTTRTKVPIAVTTVAAQNPTPPLETVDVKESQVGEGPSKPAAPPPYTRDFIMEGAPLPSNEGVRPWLDKHGGKVADCVGKTLLLPTNMENRKKMDGEGNLLALKRNMVLVRIN